jgi:hypothetical protein
MRTQPYSMADYLDRGGYEADRAAELRRCVSRSKGHGRHLEQETHTRRSTGQCGRVALLADTRNPGTHAAARLPCKRKAAAPTADPSPAGPSSGTSWP